MGDDDPDLGDPKPYVEVELSSSGDEHVDPPVVHLVDGGTVEWVANDGDHEIAAYHPDSHGTQQRIPGDAEPWTSGELAPGDSFDRIFDVEGVFDYVSTPYESEGAVGSIVVGWPDPDEAPALEEPVETYPDAAVDALEQRNDRVRDLLEEVHE
ncbi:halocyanin [Natronorubrum halalkaliphilum]|uniref:cupredoxin domain-containing protein n=1 Tax=Natronorubrum halalkaliphilum TaxID=2691917 RepID=UPI002E2D3108|nr:halocyanin [Natronorubrum halalkaliphilum]